MEKRKKEIVYMKNIHKDCSITAGNAHCWCEIINY